jgi:hypothetical protein
LIIISSFTFADIDNNSTADTAESLSINATVEGTIGYESGDGTDYYDYYKIITSSDGKLEVNVDTSVELEAVVLDYKQTNGALVRTDFYNSMDIDGSDGYHLYSAKLAKGTYYIKISKKFGDSKGSYTLTNVFTPVAEMNDEIDPNTNDTVDTAMNLLINSTKEGHIGYKTDIGDIDSYDYYKITTKSDGKLVIDVENSVELEPVVLDYMQENGMLVRTNLDTSIDRDGSDGYHLYCDNLAAGTYYVKIIEKYNTPGSGYLLTNTFIPIIEINDEIVSNTNDTVDTAMNLLMNTTKEGHIGYKTDSGKTDSYDYYKIVLKSNQTIDIFLDTDIELQSVGLNYLNSNDVLSSVDFTTGIDRDSSDGYRVYKENLDAGTYYLLIVKDVESGGYSIQIDSDIHNVGVVKEEPSSWAIESVNNLKAQNAMDNSFFNGYKVDMTRESFAYLSVKLYEKLTGDVAIIGEDIFDDTDNEWILKGYNIGILNGYGNGVYGPNDLITREQLAVLLIKTMMKSGVDYDTDISGLQFQDDDSISSWAKEYVYLANKNGILSGVGNNMMAPKSKATKEQAMIMSMRILNIK